MISTKFVLHATLILLAVLCLQALRKIGSGREIVTLHRRSALDPEAAWENLAYAWAETGLTFQTAEIEEREDGLRIVRHAPDSAIAIEPLPAPSARSIVFRVVSIDGADYLPGVAHFEHWRVEPDGPGSKIIVETRFKATVAGTIRALWGLWKQAGIVASPRMHGFIDTGQATPAANPPADRRTRPEAPARDKAAARRPQSASAAAGGYGREAVMSLLAFAYLLTQFSWQYAVVLALVILWHEYGHLLAYQLTGRTGNRMMLVPFFGGIAVAGAPHRNEFERAFCALMGPGICAPLTLGAFALWYYDVAPEYDLWFRAFFYFSSILNLLNLLPIYPLDGGQAAESFLRSYFPGSIGVHLSGLAVAGTVVLVALGFHQMALFVGLFSFFGLRNLPQHSHLPAMSPAQAMAMVVFYGLIAAAHGIVFYYLNA